MWWVLIESCLHLPTASFSSLRQGMTESTTETQPSPQADAAEPHSKDKAR